MMNDRNMITSEYIELQDTLEDFDRRAMTIKSWSITLSMAGIGAGVLHGKPSIVALSSITALLFWIIEALWKSHQQHFYRRVYEIERGIARGQDIHPFQTASAWADSFEKAGGHLFAFKIMWWPHICLPHIAVFVGGIILALALKYPHVL